MKNLKEKLRKNGGFTLVEMLIVVAIIAILIAVSIPMVGTALERSRHGVDQANIRNAISLGSVEYLTNRDVFDKAPGAYVEYAYYVDTTTHQGILLPANATADQITAAGAGDPVKPECTCKDKPADPLKVKIEVSSGKVYSNWTFTETDGIKKNTAYDALKVEP